MTSALDFGTEHIVYAHRAVVSRIHTIYKGSYMSAYVLLNLLNELEK